jgi:two-component sensor histidine kinase
VPISHAEVELEFRWRAVRAGFWLGWLSIGAALTGLLLGLAPDQRPLLLGLVLAAAFAHTVAMAVPWRRWLAATRGQLLLDLWSGGLIAFVALLILLAGAHENFDLLLFLVLPFIATVQVGWRRGLWLGLAAVAFAVAMAIAPAPLPLGAVAMRALLLAVAVLLALGLARATAREAAARAEASARAELEHALLAEAHHRVKNSLQTVADLLLLARPEGADGRAFDHTAARIRSIAAVHRLLAEARGGVVASDAVLGAVAAAVGPEVIVEADAIELDAAVAQKLGVVANELIANAVQHGRPPVTVGLERGQPLRLRIEDAGGGSDGIHQGLGLQLVRQVVEQGLGGCFTLGSRPAGGTRAEVTFEAGADAHPRR